MRIVHPTAFHYFCTAKNNINKKKRPRENVMTNKHTLFISTLIAATPTMAHVLPTTTLAAPTTVVAHPHQPAVADTSRVFDIDEVIVVTQPKELFRLRHQPLSSSSFNSSYINNVHGTDLRQLSAYVPSFCMPEYGSRLTSSMYIRGIGSRINNPSVGIYLDGMPLMSKAAYNMHFYQTERVDILRGPQGTLYGQNTEGGLVKIYSRNPFSYQGTDVLLGIGSHLWRNAEAAHYSKLNDSWALGVAAFYTGSNGFFRNKTLNTRADKQDEAGARLRLMFRPNSRLSADLLADYQYTRQNGFAYGETDPTTGHTAEVNTNYPGSYKRNMLNTALHIGYQAPRFELNSTTSYQLLRDDMLMDQDYMATDYMHLIQRQLQNSVSEELTLKNRSTGCWRWTSGAFASYQWLRTNAPVFFGPGITTPMGMGIQRMIYKGITEQMAQVYIQHGMSEAKALKQAQELVDGRGGVTIQAGMQVPGLFHTPQMNVGVFHESNLYLTPRLMATLGLRYDVNRVSVNYNTSALLSLDAKVMGIATVRKLTSALNHGTHDTYQQLLPKLGLTYTIDRSGSNIYALVSKGYRAGGYNIQMFSDILQTELMANSRKVQQGDYDVPHTSADYANMDATISYKPETSWNYEVGAHLNLFEGRLHADLSAFYMQVHNQQLSVMAGTYGYGRMMVNAGKSYSCGFEATLRGSAFDNRLSWGASYGLTHAAFSDYTDNVKVNGQQTTIDYEGRRVPFIPMHTLGASTCYTQPLRHNMVKEVRFGLDLNAQGSIYWDEANTFKQPFYAVLGAHADVVLGAVTFSVWGRNLTDTRYNTFALSSAATGTTRYFAQRSTPIHCGIDMKWHF